jgi:hypothetical protein
MVNDEVEKAFNLRVKGSDGLNPSFKKPQVIYELRQRRLSESQSSNSGSKL